MGALAEVVTNSGLKSSVPSRVCCNRVSRAKRVEPRWSRLVGRADWPEPIGEQRWAALRWATWVGRAEGCAGWTEHA